MKPRRHWLIAALAAAGFALTMTPAHADDTAPVEPLTIQPESWERIYPPERPTPDPCPVRPAPPGMVVPMYCEIIPIQQPPREIIDPIIPAPIPMSVAADATFASDYLPYPYPDPWPYPGPWPQPWPGPGPIPPWPSPWPTPWPDIPVYTTMASAVELLDQTADEETDPPEHAA